MDFALVGDSFDRHIGGIEFHTSALAKALRENGHAATIVPNDDLRRLDRESFDWWIVEGVKRPTLVKLSLMSSSRHTRKAIFTHGSYFETVHHKILQSRGYNIDGLIWVAKWISDVTLVHQIVKSFDAIFVLSERERIDLLSLAFPRERICMLPNFVSVPKMNLEPVTMDFSHFSPYVCAVARVDPRKNLRAVIRSIQGSNLSFVLAGPDAGDLRRLRELARAESLKNFHYVGVLSEADKRSLISSSLAMIIPSFFEGTPFSALESLSIGKPVVCSDLSYLDGYAGVEYCRADPRSIRAAIDRIATGPRLPVVKVPTSGDVTKQMLSFLDLRRREGKVI